MTFDEIANRHAAATAGPWEADPDTGSIVTTEYRDNIIYHHVNSHCAGCVGAEKFDREFVAASWLDVCVLLRALHLACTRIADSDQTYEGCTDTGGWADRFLAEALKMSPQLLPNQEET